MPLLILPLLLAGFVLLWLVLLPLSLRQRYKYGKARRRVIPWITGANAWLVLVSLVSFVIGAAFAQRWLDDALAAAAMGLAMGFVIGLVGIWTAHLEWQGEQLFVQPHPFVPLLITTLVAGRIVLGFWQLWKYGFELHPHVTDGPWLLRPDSLFAFGGLLLGYYFCQTWVLRSRLRRGPYQRLRVNRK